MRRLVLLILFSVLAGCAGTYRGTYAVDATVSSPELAYVGPDVYAVANYDYPVFYSSNYYWRYNGGLWYRSSRWDGGWAHYSAPPRAVVTVRNPSAYIRYRPDRRHITYRDRIDRRPAVRDHRRR